LYAQFNSEVNTTFRLRKTHYSRLACFLVINKINLDAALYLFHHVIILMCPLGEFIFLDCYNTLITSVEFSRDASTGYNQSVTGCRSQRRQCSCYSTKTHDPHPQIEYDFDEKHIQCILKVVFVEHHTQFNVDVSYRRQIQFEDADHAVYISFR